jgi:Zn-finger nucleic acid-binding protein
MICSTCRKKLDSAIFYGIEVDYCPVCLGMFFEEDELRLAKDEKDDQLRWLDIDLWKNEEEFKAKKSKKICPKCRLPFYEIKYGDSGIEVDICIVCKGVWLDRGEFRKIIEYLGKRADREVWENWAKNFKEEFWEIFTGPEIFKDELSDFLMLLKLLNYKFFARHSIITALIGYRFTK